MSSTGRCIEFLRDFFRMWDVVQDSNNDSIQSDLEKHWAGSSWFTRPLVRKNIWLEYSFPWGRGSLWVHIRRKIAAQSKWICESEIQMYNRGIFHFPFFSGLSITSWIKILVPFQLFFFAVRLFDTNYASWYGRMIMWVYVTIVLSLNLLR